MDQNSLKKIRIEIWTFSFQICFWNQFLTSRTGQTEDFEINISKEGIRRMPSNIFKKITKTGAQNAGLKYLLHQ